MMKFAITKNEQLTSFKLFDVAQLCLNDVYRTKIRHNMLFNQPRYRRNGSTVLTFVKENMRLRKGAKRRICVELTLDLRTATLSSAIDHVYIKKLTDIIIVFFKI